MRHDPKRLAELRRAMILDSGPERAYDDITRMLASTLGVPIAMVNLMDEHRDWFKSCVGLDLQESPAATSFCESFFQTDDQLIVVEDTMQDLRFSSHPLVVGAPFIRFYASCRVVLRGQTLGTLCAYDLKPRQLSPEQVQNMQAMALAATTLMERRTGPA